MKCQFLNGDFYFRSMPTASTKCVNLELLSQIGVEVRAHYPMYTYYRYEPKSSLGLKASDYLFLIFCQVLGELQKTRRGSLAFAGKEGFITLRDLFRQTVVNSLINLLFVSLFHSFIHPFIHSSRRTERYWFVSDDSTEKF